MKNSEITVALLVGGASPEREVSKESSKAVYEALIKLDYKVKIIDPSYGQEQPVNIEDYFLANKDFADVSSEKYVHSLNKENLSEVDVVFIGLHGKWGEDGAVQSLLELNKIKYTGSGILSSAVGMDKNMSKIMFEHFGVTTPKWFVIDSDESNYSLVKEKIKNLFDYPCIIKANDSGSTIGLTVCKEEADVEAACKDAGKYSRKIIIEEFIPGYELTVAVLDKQALPPLEIKPKHGLYDYECKYTDGMSEYIVPAEFPEKLLSHLQQQALLAYESIGCSNYARVDFRVNENHESYCLEVNTLPGMTSHSLVPKMAKAAGINFEELIDRIIKYALV